jgi:hypothetical protein
VKPSRALAVYYAITFAVGVLLTLPISIFLNTHELGAKGAAVMTLTWNVLFIMILPLVLDWSERTHCKARFLNLEELKTTNPELAAAIMEQCQKLSIPSLRLAIVNQGADELFSYGLWGYNPRLILPNALLTDNEKTLLIPSIEAELTRFASQDHTMVFLLFTVVQIVIEQITVALI